MFTKVGYMKQRAKCKEVYEEGCLSQSNWPKLLVMMCSFWNFFTAVQTKYRTSKQTSVFIAIVFFSCPLSHICGYDLLNLEIITKNFSCPLSDICGGDLGIYRKWRLVLGRISEISLTLGLRPRAREISDMHPLTRVISYKYRVHLHKYPREGNWNFL